MSRALLASALVALVAAAPPTDAQVIPKPKNCSHTSVGFVPLNDLGTGTYLGEQGGLYPGGLNMRPSAHELAGVQLAQSIEPLDVDGNPDPDGRIVLAGLGHSNGNLFFSAVKKGLIDIDPARDSDVVFLNAGQPGKGVLEWANPFNVAWFNLLSELEELGSSFEQVQVVWLHTVWKFPDETEVFPVHAETSRAGLEYVARNVTMYMPNVKLMYLTPRVYGDYYIEIPLLAEPYAYESAFAIKWLIEKQIQGDAGLNYDPANGAVVAPWMSWGPYWWADGVRARSDGLRWVCDDFGFDGLHPEVDGGFKIIEQMERFLHTDSTTSEWYLASSGAPCGPQAQVVPEGGAVPGETSNPRLAISDLPLVPSGGSVNAFAFDAPPGAPGVFRLSVPGLAAAANVRPNPGPVGLPAFQLVPAVTDAFGHASFDLGEIPDSPAYCGLEMTAQFLVLDGPGWASTERMRLHVGN